MPKIDFYLLTNDNENSQIFICRLLEKAYLHEHQIYVYCNSLKDLQLLDTLLWTFHDISFIPHQTFDNLVATQCPITLSIEQPAAEYKDILINLHEEVPPFFQQFERVIEVVPVDEGKKSLARLHYAKYRDHGFVIETHQLKS